MCPSFENISGANSVKSKNKETKRKKKWKKKRKKAYHDCVVRRFARNWSCHCVLSCRRLWNEWWSHWDRYVEILSIFVRFVRDEMTVKQRSIKQETWWRNDVQFPAVSFHDNVMFAIEQFLLGRLAERCKLGCSLLKSQTPFVFHHKVAVDVLVMHIFKCD